MSFYEDKFGVYGMFGDSLFLDFYRYSDHPEVKKVVESIFSEFTFNKFTKKEIQYKTNDYIKLLVCNFFVGYASQKCLAIPKTPRFYQDSKNFRFGLIRHEIFLGVLEHLYKQGYIGYKQGYKNSGEKGFVSRYWAREKLYSQFTDIDWSMIFSTVGDEVILHNSDRQDIDYDDTPYTGDLREQLKAINAVYEEHRFYAYIDGHKTRLFPRVAAIFCRGEWTCGGRLYSIVKGSIPFQQVSRENRAFFDIDGQTVELDYSGLHLNMLYAKIGIQYTQDPYSFVSDELRPVVKTFLLTLINARSDKSAVQAMKQEIFELKNKKYISSDDKKRLELLETVDWWNLLYKIKAFHSPIASFFGSDVGVKLQNEDGKMALEIVEHFAKINIPVLPVHDSFIIQKRFEAQLKDIMTEVYRRFNNGFDCKIK